MSTNVEEQETQRLEKLFIEFARSVLEHMKNQVTSGGLSLILSPQLLFQDTNTWFRRIGVQKDYRQLLDSCRDHVYGLEVTQECAYAHWKAKVIKVTIENEESQNSEKLSPTLSHLVIDYLLVPLLNAIQQYDGLELTDEQLLRIYQISCEAWLSEAIRQDALIPLLNFRAEVEVLPTDLGTAYQLASFSAEEKTNFWTIVDFSRLWDLFPFYSFLAAEFKLQGFRIHPKMPVSMTEQFAREFSLSHQRMLNDIRYTVTAMRLLKAGDVAVTAYIEQSNEYSPHHINPSMGIPGTGLSDFQVRRHGNPYVLQQTDLPAIRSLVEALQSLGAREHMGGLEIALRRFNQSYSRDFFEDRLIDLTNALESCLLEGLDSKTELKYRFILRGTALLANQKKATRNISASRFIVRCS